MRAWAGGLFATRGNIASNGILHTEHPRSGSMCVAVTKQLHSCCLLLVVVAAAAAASVAVVGIVIIVVAVHQSRSNNSDEWHLKPLFHNR